MKTMFVYYCKMNANILKFNQLLSSRNILVLEKLCKFIKVIAVKGSRPGLGNTFCFCTCILCFVDNTVYVVFIFSVTM
jgi:hypothetical protein